MGNTRKPIDADDDDNFMEGEFHKASANNDAGSDPPIFGGLILAAGGAMAERNYYVRKALTERRNPAVIKQQLREECMQAGDMMFYSWGKGDNHVEGGSIGLAMTLARIWGNCVIECLPPQENATSFILTTRFIDLETGFTNERPFRQSKKAIVAGKMDEERKMDTRFQVGYSKAARNVVKNSISFYLWDQAIKWAKEGTKKKIEDWIANLDKQESEREPGDRVAGITIAQDKTIRRLMKHGMTEYKPGKNAGGIACGGDVYAEYFKPNAAHGVYVTIGADIGVGLGREGDGIHCMARWVEKNAAPKRSRKDGPNNWPRLDKDSDELAEMFATLANRKNEETPVGAS